MPVLFWNSLCSPKKEEQDDAEDETKESSGSSSSIVVKNTTKSTENPRKQSVLLEEKEAGEKSLFQVKLTKHIRSWIYKVKFNKICKVY